MKNNDDPNDPDHFNPYANIPHSVTIFPPLHPGGHHGAHGPPEHHTTAHENFDPCLGKHISTNSSTWEMNSSFYLGYLDFESW